MLWKTVAAAAVAVVAAAAVVEEAAAGVGVPLARLVELEVGMVEEWVTSGDGLNSCDLAAHPSKFKNIFDNSFPVRKFHE